LEPIPRTTTRLLLVEGQPESLGGVLIARGSEYVPIKAGVSTVEPARQEGTRAAAAVLRVASAEKFAVHQLSTKSPLQGGTRRHENGRTDAKTSRILDVGAQPDTCRNAAGRIPPSAPELERPSKRWAFVISDSD
jgi:hypothetical protein